MQEVSGSIPLGSTKFSEIDNVRGHYAEKRPDLQQSWRCIIAIMRMLPTLLFHVALN